MATINGLTAEAMQEIRDAVIVGAHIDGDDLVLELFDSSEINVGDVRGPQGVQGPNADIGDIKGSIRSSIPGWLLMGTSVPTCDITYPAFWGYAPASWKSGTTLNIPPMSDRILQGDGAGTAVGDLTGAATSVITSAHLPPHAHTGPVHTHPIDHNHASFSTSGLDGGHDHMGYNVAYTAPAAGGSWFVRRATDGPHNAVVAGSTGSAHGHTIDIPAYSGNSGAATAANTGNGPGTSTPLSVEQPAVRVNFFIYPG
jgi:hypothetical protein